MPRRVKSQKKKNYAGNRSYGGGNAKNRRGKGNKGGKGRAGIRTHKWFRKIKTEGTRGSKGQGFINSHPASRHVLNFLNVFELAYFAKDGVVNLPGTKVLSGGLVGGKYHVKAAAFSEKAKVKIEEAGGQAEILGHDAKTKADSAAQSTAAKEAHKAKKK